MDFRKKVLISFKYDVPLEDTMEFETVYHKNLRLDLPEKKEIRNIPGSIFVWLYVDGKLTGESHGVPMEALDESIEGLDDLSEDEKKAAIYCYSNTILPAYQGQGLGRVLKAHWLGVAVGKGFNAVYGHARPGGSQVLNTAFGAVFGNSFPDWYGTGEEYRIYKLILSS